MENMIMKRYAPDEEYDPCEDCMAYEDDGSYLDSGYEIGTEATAWMPLPEPWKGEDNYERGIEQMQNDMLYEPTYNSEDGSM